MKNISILFLFMNLFCAMGADFHLVENQHPAASIVLMEKASDSIKKSIENFNLTLKTITGTELPVVRETSGNQILFSVNKINSLNTADFFTISFPDSRTMLIECTEISIQWAFNHLIREYAKAEWILPESCGLSYTPMQNLVIPARKIEVKDISWPINRVHSVRTIWWMHNFRQGLRVDHDLTRHAFPLSKYGKNNSWPSAIMPVLNGKKITALPDPKHPRQFWQPCYSNPETARIAIENLFEYLKCNPGLLGLSLGANDNVGFCKCRECRNLNKNRPDYNSESYFTFINRVLDEVCKKYPDLVVSVFAYQSTYLPPSFKLHPNALVYLTIDFNSCISPGIRESHKKIIAEWSKKASMLGVWDYSWGYPYPVPRMYAPYHLDMLKYVFEHNGRSYYGQSWTFDAHEGPKQYLITKFLWNSKQDMKKLEEEWYIRCVGKKAAPYLKAYFKVWNDYFTGAATRTPWFKAAPTVFLTYNDVSCIFALREKDIQEADKAMQQVVALAETEQEKKRAELLMRHWRQSYLRLRLLGAGIYDDAGSIQTRRQALQLLNTVIQSPEYLKEYNRISDTFVQEKNLRFYYLSKPYMEQGGTPVRRKFDHNINSHILAASQFAADPEVKQIMKKIASDPRQINSARVLCDLLQDPDSHKNLLIGGNAEEGINATFSIHQDMKDKAILSVTEDYAAEGKKSFQVDVRGHKILFQVSAMANPKKKYAFSFKVFIPRPSAEGYLQALGLVKEPVFHPWRGVTALKLSGGIWQTFSVMTPPVSSSGRVWLRIYLCNFEVGDKVYIDDIRLMEIKDYPVTAASTKPKPKAISNCYSSEK